MAPWTALQWACSWRWLRSTGWVGAGDSTRLRPPSQCPRRLAMDPLDQPGAPFVFRAYAGSGLVSQWLARVQATRKRRSTTRMASLLTSRGVSPGA